MENKRKEIGMRRISNTERKKKILPPCRVCRSPGAGCHYGVVTCGGCKGFFHRALQHHRHYICERNERCDILNAKGKLCQWCRYQTCLAVGMSKDAIKTGRYTLSERTKYILEIKGLRNGKQQSERNTSQKIGDKQGTQFQNDFHETCCESTIPSDAGPDDSQVTQMTTTSSSILPDTMRHYQQHPTQSPTIGNTNVHPASRLSIQYKSDTDGFGLPTVDTKPSSSTSDYHEDVHPFLDCSLQSEEQKCIMDLYSDNTVLTTLMDSHERNLGYINEARSKKNLLEDTQSHYEICRRDTLLYTKRLQDEGYDSATDVTGLATSMSDYFLSDIVEDVEFFTRKMVCFVKSVPGFSRLDMSDKINLIKFGRFEFTLLCGYENINYDLAVVRSFSNRGCTCPYDLIRYNFKDKIPLLKHYVNVSQRLSVLNLSEEEIVLLKALAILAPDRVTTRNSAMVHEIHWRLTQLLLFQLSKSHRKPHLIFAKIIGIVTEFRKIEFDINDFLRNLNMKQNDMEDKPLTREMLTGTIFLKDD